MLHAISPVSEADSVDGRAILRTVYLQLSATKAVIKGADLSEQIILLVDSNADEDEESFFFEMQLKPQSDSEAEKIYEALCECSSLNHDDCSDDSEQDLDSDGDRDDVEELAGASVLIAEDEVEKDAGHQINSDVGEESNFKYENDTTPSTDSGVEKRRKIESDEPEK